jgi:hypothetical protein
VSYLSDLRVTGQVVLDSLVCYFRLVPQLTIASLSAVIASARFIVDLIPFMRGSCLLAVLSFEKHSDEDPRQHDAKVGPPAVRQFPIKASV